MKKACVIGWPITHSRSPLIHGFWLKQYGIDGSYDRVPVPPEGLHHFVSSLAMNGYLGCNVTIPHKEQVFAMVEPGNDLTRRLGVVNTVYRRDDYLMGISTDGEGFIANLRASLPSLSLKGKRAVMLGAGGAAMAIAGALIAEGVTELVVANRSPQRTEILRRKFGVVIVPARWEDRSVVLESAGLLVNTTSLGMTGQPVLDISLDRLPREAVVTDIVYAPLRTPLLENAAERGHPIVEGLGMLLHQAVPGFELWFGKRPAVTRELYDLVVADLQAAK
ncbi:shikimate dehydrogenase [Aestuariivirga sp.]|uniref:shikimate dehydrogenase n=1 Tax=Aestuariivirga sp. TaxID=2650926 RepID=UPI0039E302D2